MGTHDTEGSKLLGPGLVTRALERRVTAPLIDVQPPIVEVPALAVRVLAGKVVGQCDTSIRIIGRSVADKLSEAVGRDVGFHIAECGLDVGCGLDIGRCSDDFVTDVETDDWIKKSRSVSHGDDIVV